MNIMHVLHDGELGGVLEHVRQIVSYLREMNHVVVLGGYGPSEDEFRSLGIRTVVVELTGHQFQRGKISHLRQLIRENDIDIVHGHQPRAYLRSRIAAGFEKVPHVSTPHGSLLLESKAVEIAPLRLAYMRAREYVTSFLDHSTIAFSNVSRRELLWQGIHRDKIVIIPNGVDGQKFSPALWSDQNNTIEPKQDFIVGAVGRLCFQKGFDNLLRWFADLPELNDAGQVNRLVLVGDGDMRTMLVELASSLCISKRVSFLGERTDIPQLLAGFDIVALSSRFEGMPYTLLEAMSMKKPIIAIDLPIFQEMLEPGCGLIATPEEFANELIRLINDETLRLTVAEAAGDRAVQEYEASVVMHRLAELYRRITTQRRS